ncbi:MAG: T9SS type A sorting domain-containing protein, partial [Candidatus Marinimicrobia bacterium]|nr:T9SS type A sorting domain-containing protein [Candidatus Neomarinimicrobiota bacterium]
IVSIDQDREIEIPNSVSLHQNYPNPFNPETMLSFSLPTTMHVRLSIYDIRGRELEELVNGQLEAGEHKHSFNGSDYATGVYMVVMETKFGTQVRRMLLLK